MKVRVLSDLHLEFRRYLPLELPSCGEDLVVLAGDIGEGIKGIEWAKQAIPDRPVVYVLGNHEFYKHDWDMLLEEAHAAVAGSNVHVLECESVEIAGLRVLGCSLWTDYRAMGALTQSTAIAMAQHEMVDFRLIRRARKTARIMPVDVIRRCEKSRLWLQNEITASERPLLVVTHHAPTLRTVSPKYLLALSNAAFHNDFDELVRPPVLAWIHGHTHYSCDLEVAGVRMVSNQGGYPEETGCEFNWDLVIEVAP